MNTNPCPLCRRAMRYWALDARWAPTAGLRRTCIQTAISFRDQCLCMPEHYAEEYASMVRSLNQIMDDPQLTTAKKWEVTAQLRRMMERVKNCCGGMAPTAVGGYERKEAA